jgi:hypothetical protein
MAKLIRKSLPKNFVSRSHRGFRVRSQAVSYAAIIAESPMLTGTNRKW